MKRISTTLQILVIVTIALSGLLLGMSQGDFEPLLIALSAALVAWVSVDVFRWFSLPQWLANLVAVIVTVVTVASFFFLGDSIRQLLGVGKLLVYLQSILLFQKKSARVYWQVLVLSLLQIVVGAVFNLGFEGGVLFITYLLVAGVTMLFLHLYQQQELVSGKGLHAARLAARRDPRYRLITVSSSDEDGSKRRILRRMARHYLVMGGGTFLFGIALFYFLPRENSTWSGPAEVPMPATGYMQKVSMTHPDLIPLSNRLAMTVAYHFPESEEPYLPREQPYLRGMALANLVIENNNTTWQAAHSQVDGADFSGLVVAGGDNNRRLVQDIVIEPTDDPLVYSPFPAQGVGSERDSEIEFCWTLGALTRQRMSNKITVSHYRYSLAIPILPNGAFCDAYPYRSRRYRLPLTESADKGTYDWLTNMDPARYPDLVRVAGEIAVASRRNLGNDYLTALAMQDYFSEQNGFSYTIDFRNIRRNSAIDSVEDFFANHRSGHCSYYASALALMLRSQGIPARVVVGFRGGVNNEFGKHIDVEEKHAHAWVEAYIPPEDCPPEWASTGQAGRIGAWLQLDATPAIDYDQLLAGDALNYARSFWRDYVMGLQAETGATVVNADGMKLSGLFQALDLAWWQANLNEAASSARQAGTWQNFLLKSSPLILFGIGLTGYYFYRKRRQKELATRSRDGTPKQKSTFANRISRWLSDAVGGIAPSLGRWLDPEHESKYETPFYRTFAATMKRKGWVRRQGQTPLEFANSIVDSGDDLPITEIGSLSRFITDCYYTVRFGSRQLSSSQQASVDKALDRLKQLLENNQVENDAGPLPT